MNNFKLKQNLFKIIYRLYHYVRRKHSFIFIAANSLARYLTTNGIFTITPVSPHFWQ